MRRLINPDPPAFLAIPKCFILHYELYRGGISNAVSNYMRSIMNSNAGQISQQLVSKYTLLEIKYKLKKLVIHWISNLRYLEHIVHFVSQTYLIIFTPSNKQKSVININWRFDCYAETISYNNCVYITGGKFSDAVYEIDLYHSYLKVQQPMKTKKYGHSLCCSYGYIYATGGYSSTPLKDSQQYDVKNKTWVQLPDLIVPRFRGASFTFNNAKLFCFCGPSESCLYSTELLDLKKKARWENILINSKFDQRSCCHGIQVGKSSVLIFGGYNIKEELSSCDLLNMNEMQFRECKGLLRQSLLYNCSAPICINRVVYAVDYDKRIHIVDLNNDRRELIS